MKKIVAIIFLIILGVLCASCSGNAEDGGLSGVLPEGESGSLSEEEITRYYTIYYELGGDSYAEIESKTQMVTFGAEIHLHEPTCYGYEFLGWMEKDSNEPFTLTTYIIERDSYLVASWGVDPDSDRWFTPDI